MPSPRYTREIPQRYRLEGNKCKVCGKIWFPPRIICRNCGGNEFEKVKLSENGKILTFTIVRVPSKKFAYEAPYIVGIIELEDGVRITTQIVDCNPDDVEIGKEVRIIFRRVQEEGHEGIICYGYKAVLK